MKLQQLKYVVEVCRQNNHFSAAAETLHTSQPGLSRQIQLLEEELGFAIFQRNRNRILGLTEPGRRIVEIAQRVIIDIDSLKSVQEDFAAQTEGMLTIATTHTPARYVLPDIVQRFAKRYPQVKIGLRQGNPTQVCAMVDDGSADIAIGSETSQQFHNLAKLPCLQLARSIVARKNHPILKARPLTLEQIAKYPIITHDPSFSGRWRVMDAFKKRGLAPDFMFGIVDADVSKAYVERDLGIAILPSMAIDPERDVNLRARDIGHLFPRSTIYVTLRKTGYLPRYVFDFIKALSPALTADVVQAAVNSRKTMGSAGGH